MVKLNDTVNHMFNFSMRLWYNTQAVNKKTNTATRQRWLYTAITRAAKSLTVVR